MSSRTKPLVVVDLDNRSPAHYRRTSARPLSVIPRHRRTIPIAFVVDRDGLKVLDVTDLANQSSSPTRCPLDDARNVYVAALTLTSRQGSKDSRSLMSKKPDAPKSIKFSPLKASS